MDRNVIRALVAITLALVAVAPAGAQEAVWSCAGKQVLRLHATAAGVSAEKRVETLDERVNNLLSKHSVVNASDITLIRDRGQVFLSAFGDVLVTVTPEDASANATTREKLAHTWLANMRATLPQLSPRVNKHGA